MEIVLLLIIFSGIVFYEVPPLVQKKQWRELISASVILVFGFMLCLFQVIGVKLPNPSRIIAFIFNLQY